MRWAALAATFVVQQDLAPSTSIVALFAADQSAVYGQGASEVLRSTVEKDGERLRVHAVVTDLGSQANRLTVESEGPAREGLIARLDAISKRLDPQRASPFSTRKDGALQAFVAAASASKPEDRVNLLEQAVSVDPAFGLAHTALLEAMPTRPLPDAQTVQHFVPLDRARYAALVARINHAPIPALAGAASAVLNVAPNNVEALSQLGWLSFLQGKPADGERLLRKAIGLTSQNLPLQLQLVQGLVASRRFGEAVGLLNSLAAANPSLLPGLAVAKLLNGDVAGANTTFGRFAGLLPASTPAKAFAEEQWKAIVEKTPPAAAVNVNTPLAEGYRAFLERRFADAISLWQNVVRQTSGTDLRARAMLAASSEGSGQESPVDVLPYLPDLTDPYAPIAFNEMRRILKM